METLSHRILALAAHGTRYSDIVRALPVRAGYVAEVLSRARAAGQITGRTPRGGRGSQRCGQCGEQGHNRATCSRTTEAR